MKTRKGNSAWLGFRFRRHRTTFRRFGGGDTLDRPLWHHHPNGTIIGIISLEPVESKPGFNVPESRDFLYTTISPVKCLYHLKQWIIITWCLLKWQFCNCIRRDSLWPAGVNWPSTVRITPAWPSVRGQEYFTIGLFCYSWVVASQTWEEYKKIHI